MYGIDMGVPDYQLAKISVLMPTVDQFSKERIRDPQTCTMLDTMFSLSLLNLDVGWQLSCSCFAKKAPLASNNLCTTISPVSSPPQCESKGSRKLHGELTTFLDLLAFFPKLVHCKRPVRFRLKLERFKLTLTGFRWEMKMSRGHAVFSFRFDFFR